MEANATDKPVPREITALLSDERLILRETQRAVTPCGGVAVFISFLGKIGFVKAVREHMPIRWRSPNHIDPTSTFTAFLLSVLVGARRFAQGTQPAETRTAEPPSTTGSTERSALSPPRLAAQRQLGNQPGGRGLSQR